MICRNCGVKLVKGLDKCPICGTKIEHEEIIEKEIKNNIENLELPVLKSEDKIIELDDTDTNLGDNNFEIELKEKEEDENFDKFEGIDNTEENDTKREEETFSEDDVSLEKTRSISTIDDSQELNNLSLIDDINRQIENVNEEVKELNENVMDESSYFEEHSILNDEESGSNNLLRESDDLTSKDSLRKRKKIFVITGIVFLILVIVLGIILYFGSKFEKASIGDNYIEKLSDALQKYYDTRDIDDVIYVLEDVKRDSEKIKDVQAKTRTTCDSWLLLYFDEKVNTRQEFDEISEKYKELLNGLHNYALIKYDDKRIKALTDTDYDELLEQVNDIYSDSTMFYDSLALYDSKDYNKAYYSFDRIGKDNKYYEKSISYKNKIIDNILEIMQKDITKIENGIDSLEDKEKLQKYTQIESIIFEYNNVYATCKLSDNETYQNILSTYNSKVLEYSDIVLNGDNEDIIEDKDNQDSIGENEEKDNENQILE